jgi:glutamate-1-semialdehyde 2,1-aminomutase
MNEKFDKLLAEEFEKYEKTRMKSRILYEKACNYMPGGDTRTATFFEPYPHFIVEGNGAYMTDADGNRMIDFQNNYTSLIHGHNHPPTVEAVRKQMELGSAYASPFEKQTELAEILVNRFPSIDLIRFCNSGTEATMHILRIARAYTGKTRIIKTEGGYHGSSDIFEASVDPDISKAGTLDAMKVIPDSRGVSPNSLEDVIVVPFNDIERTKIAIEENHQDVACMIIEPVMGSAGQITPTVEYLKALREMTREYGVLLVFDEVVTGRLSMGGAQKHYGVTPDLTALGKIIGGGTAIGAFGGRRDIMEIYDPRKKMMYHSGTFNGNALAMAAGIATLNCYTQKEVDYVNELGDYFKRGVMDAYDDLGLDMQVTGAGSIRNILFTAEKVTNYRDVARAHEEFNKLLFIMLLNRGVFDAPRGMFSMTTAMAREDVAAGIEAIAESLKLMMASIEEGAPELIKR